MSGRYDRAITIFSPDGRLYQVEYALEAVKRGSAVVGVRGAEVVVLGVERRATAKLQDARTVRKIVKLDDHIVMAFAGLTADARVLTTRARIECQSYRLTCEDQPTLDYMARYIAKTQQRYTQRGGVRPFGVSSMLAGFSTDGEPQLFQTDPAGTYSEWRANAIGGRNARAMREYLEKSWNAGLSEDDCVRLAVKALLEVVDSGSKNMEVVVLRRGQAMDKLSEESLDEIIASVEREAEEAKQKGGGDDDDDDAQASGP